MFDCHILLQLERALRSAAPLAEHTLAVGPLTVVPLRLAEPAVSGTGYDAPPSDVAPATMLPKIIVTLMYQGLTFECIVRMDFPEGKTFLNLRCCAMRSVNLCHEFQRTIAVHHTICTRRNGTAMANCLRHFSVQLKVPSSIFACSSFSTRCPSQKYFEQKARQDSFGVRFLTG